MCTNWLIPPDAAWERLSIWGPPPNRVTHRCPLKLLPSRNHDLRLHCEVLGAPVGVFATMVSNAAILSQRRMASAPFSSKAVQWTDTTPQAAGPGAEVQRGLRTECTRLLRASVQVGVPGAVSRKCTVRVMKEERSSIGEHISYHKNNH